MSKAFWKILEIEFYIGVFISAWGIQQARYYISLILFVVGYGLINYIRGHNDAESNFKNTLMDLLLNREE